MSKLPEGACGKPSRLPEEEQDALARILRAYRLFRNDPNHPGLGFKPLHPTQPTFSVPIGAGYRAVGVREGSR